VAASSAATTSCPLGPPLDLPHHVARDLLGGDELHQPQRRQRLELAGAEQAVLPRVQEDAVQRLPRLLPRLARPSNPASATGPAGIDARNGTPAAHHLAEADALPRDGGGGLDLLDAGAPGVRAIR
jgi:hypothetical protein